MRPNVGTSMSKAIDTLKRGGVIGLPTETVYGLAADARDVAAVRRVFTIKGRPLGHPLIVHVADTDEARRWSSEWPESARALADRFWPGPLTLIVPRADHVLDEVTGGRTAVALRVPVHPVARRILSEFRGGVVAPSANLFGRVSPTTAVHVSDDLGDSVDYVLDGGPCTIGLESTIVDCTVDPPQVLRPGVITEEEIAATVGPTAPVGGPSRAPGMLTSHYAPECIVIPVESSTEAEAMRSDDTEVLDASIDPLDFATSLYAELRRCDREGRRRVVIVLPADEGVGRAVRDRIGKAAAERS